MSVVKIGRRNFLGLCSSAGAGLVLGFYLPSKGEAAPPPDSKSAPFKPNAWVSIDRQGRVTLIVSRSEMGQGVQTSLPMLIAEELEVSWSKIDIQAADLDPAYGNQNTGGSASIKEAWEPLRKAGATAREMLIAAAAQKWGVAPGSCRAQEGMVIHTPTGRKVGYGNLVEQASRLPVPKDVPLKDPKDQRIIGKRMPRFDTPLKVDGSAVFGLDVRVPGMLYASILRCPIFGGRLSCFDESKARAVPGVREIVPIGAVDSVGVAVVADSTWAALQGRRALQATWDPGRDPSLSSSTIRQRFIELSSKPGAVARQQGDAAAAIRAAAKKVEAVYEVPYLAHATMEPMNCTAYVQSDRLRSGRPPRFRRWFSRLPRASPDCRRKRSRCTSLT